MADDKSKNDKPASRVGYGRRDMQPGPAGTPDHPERPAAKPAKTTGGFRGVIRNKVVGFIKRHRSPRRV